MLSRYAVLLAVLERYDEALDTSRRALELDPRALSVIRNDGIILMAAGQNERGLAQLRRLTELDPTFSRGHFSLGIGYCQVGRYDEAIDEFETYLSQSKEGKAYSPLPALKTTWSSLMPRSLREASSGRRRPGRAPASDDHRPNRLPRRRR